MRNSIVIDTALSVIGTPDLNADGTQKKNDDGTLKFKYTPNGAELQVDWDTDLNRWQSSAYGLVYGRDEQAPGTPDDSGSSYWYAKEGTDVSNMKRVMWDSRKEFSQWYKYDHLSADGWARNENNKRLFWNGTDFIPEL